MKTKSSLLTAAISAFLVMIFTLPLFAGKPVISSSDKVQKIIKESIKYPDQAIKSCCQGSVDVIFTLREDGKINILKTFSTNEDIEKLVREQLSTVCCKGVKTPYNEHYKITISFKLIG